MYQTFFVSLGLPYLIPLPLLPLLLPFADLYLHTQKDKYPSVKGSPANDGRAVAKFLKEAQRVKKILSANVETVSQVKRQALDLYIYIYAHEWE